MKTKQQLLSDAEQFIKDYDVTVPVNAVKGGVISLNELLVDFHTRESQFTMDDLKAIPDGMPFAIGYAPNSPEGLYMSNTGGNLTWVAVKGHANDWCIYTNWSHLSIDYIMSNGDKLYSSDHIRKCINCTFEVFNNYRF